MTGDDPLPSAPPSVPSPGLPRWVLPVALFGLAILLISTLPALVVRRRLDRSQRRLDEEVRAMESSTERWFPDARVKTCITILERCSDESVRRKNPVRFVRFGQAQETFCAFRGAAR